MFQFSGADGIEVPISQLASRPFEMPASKTPIVRSSENQSFINAVNGMGLRGALQQQ